MHPLTEILPARAPEVPDRPARWKRGATLGALLVLVGLSAVFTYQYLFITFRLPDDEGYFLLALRAYRAGHTLYGEIDTVYGPFYFEFVGGFLQLFGIPLDNVTARWFVLVVLVLTCLFIYRYVWRVTRSGLAALLAYFLTFPNLNHLASATLHPSGLIVLLISLLTLVTLGLRDPSKRSRALLVAGAITAAIALSKLNAGAFVLIAFAAVFCCFAPRTRWGTALRIAVVLFLTALPFVLMAPQLRHADMRIFAWTTSLSLLPFGLLAFLDSDERSPLPVTPYVVGGSALTAVVLTICLLTGSTLSGLWHSLILGTLRFPGAFVLAPHFEPGIEVLLELALIPIVFSTRLRWMSWVRPSLRTLFKLTGGLALLVLCFGDLLNSFRGLPLVWLVAVPGTTSKRGLETRTILALLAVLLSLHTYPVGGNQAVLCVVLLPAVGILTVWDAFADLPVEWRVVMRRTPWRIAGAAAALLILALFHSVRANAFVLAKQFQKGVPLALPGAESVRVPERRAAEFNWVTANLRHHGDTFVGIPGMHSFYFWSGLVPPVPFYPNTWILFYDEEQQAELAQALLASDRPCIVRSRGLIEFWTGGRKLPEGPLVRTAEHDFKVAGAVGEYELLIPPSAQPDLLLSVLPEPTGPELIERFKSDRVCRLTFPVMDGVHVSRVTVRSRPRGPDLLDSAADDVARRVTIAGADGKDRLRHGSSDVINLSTRSDIFMLLPPSSPPVSAEDLLVRAYDEKGEIVARLLVPNGMQMP